MGAHQSTAGPSTGPKSTPIRPRTPLRFGSVPTALPVDPAQYNTRPIRNLHANFVISDPITCILSQESYLYPRSYSPAPSEDDMSSPASMTSSLSDFPPARYLCPHHNCAYSVIGFFMPEDLDIHLQTEPHFAPEQMMPMETEYPQPMQQMPRWMNAQPQEHSIHCNYFECNAYQDWPAQHQQDQQYQHQQEMDYAYHQQMMQMQQHHLQMHMPMIVGYNGPEVENLNWSGDKILKSSMPVGGAYPVLKRQRLDYHIHA